MNRKLIKRFIGPLVLVLIFILDITTFFIEEGLTNHQPSEEGEKEYTQKHVASNHMISTSLGIENSGAVTVTSDNSGKNTDNNEYNAGTNPMIEAITDNANIILMITNIVLTFFTYLLWRSSVTLSKDSRRTSTRQASEMEKSLTIAKDSIKITRLGFTLTHRPKIIVHTFVHQIDKQRCISPVLTCVNVGTSKATITMFSSDLKLTNKLRSGDKILGKNCDTDINPGEFKTFTVQSKISNDTFNVENEKRNRPNTISKNYVCVGHIDYNDDAGTKRTTGFCRRFDDPTTCWVITEDPNYEYAY